MDLVRHTRFSGGRAWLLKLSRLESIVFIHDTEYIIVTKNTGNMKINVTLATWFNWCVRIYWSLGFNRLVWIDWSVWLIWVSLVWPLGLYSSCATSLFTVSPVIKSIVISTTSSVHKLQTATFSYVVVPTWVVSCARSRISWQCTRICNQSKLGGVPLQWPTDSVFYYF